MLTEERLKLKHAELELKRETRKQRHQEKMAQIRLQQTQLEASMATYARTGIPFSPYLPHLDATILPMAQFYHAAAPPAAQAGMNNATAPPVAQVGMNNAEGREVYGAGTSGPSVI
jgi:hypothetical protein